MQGAALARRRRLLMNLAHFPSKVGKMEERGLPPIPHGYLGYINSATAHAELPYTTQKVDQLEQVM